MFKVQSFVLREFSYCNGNIFAKKMLKIVFVLLFSATVAVTGFAQLSSHQEQLEYYRSLGISADQYEQVNVAQPKSSESRAGCTLNKVVYGWHPYWSNGLQSNYDWNLLSHLCYFSYEVNASTGNADNTHSFSTTQVVTDALANNVKVTLCVTLFSNHATFLGSSAAKQTLITNLINLIQARGAHGVNIDFEGIPSSQKTNFTNFMIDLSNQMHAAIPGSDVSTVLYAVDWNNVYDIAAMDNYVDHFIIMGYDYYWTGSTTAGPNDPLFHFGTSYNYTLSKSITFYLDQGMQPEQLILGLPYYGREWPVSQTTIPAPATANGTSRTYQYVKNNSTGFYSPANRNHDDESVSTYFTFNNSGTRQCFISMEYDLGKRMDLINQRGIGGMGIWALGYDDGYNEFWNEIENHFTDCATTNCSDTIYDAGGGILKNYYDNEDYTWTIAPDNATSVTVNFSSFSVETNYDYLYIYDGPTIASPQIAGSPFTGTNSPGSFTSSGGAITFRFTSDGSTVASGWNATYSCTTDSDAPVTSVSTTNNWQTSDFNITFSDSDAGSGVDETFYQVLDHNGNEWRANSSFGFFNDNFDYVLSNDWTQQTGSWVLNSQRLNFTDDTQGNSNIYTALTQNNSQKYLYHWNANMGGIAGNRRSGMHFFCDNPSLPNRGNSYFVYYRADSDKCQIYEVVNDVFTLQTDDVCVLNPNQWYDFKVSYDPQTGKIKAYCDDVLVSQWTDSSPLSSGNSISLRSGNTNVLYDDVKVYKSRNTNATLPVTIGSSADEVRFQNNGMSNNSCRVKSIINDIAGNWSADAALNTNIDWTSPLDVTVNDGLAGETDTIYDNTEISGNWSASSDPHSGIQYYEYCVGTFPSGNDIINWTNNGTNLSFTQTGLSLAYNQMYYVTVYVRNNAGLASNITNSDGQYLILPTAPANALYQLQNTTVCESDSVQYINNSSNSTSWLWNFPGGNPSSSTLQHPKVKYTSSGLYISDLIAYGPGGNDTLQQTISVTLQPLPISEFEVNDTVLYLPGAFLATVNNSANANSYFWDFNDGNISFDSDPWNLYTQTGTYSVMLIASNSFCDADTSIVFVTVNNNLTVDELSIQEPFVYPNPTSDFIFIQNILENSQIILTDINGKTLHKAELCDKNHTIDLRKFEAGMYMLEIHSENSERKYKVVKW
jgi:spore germination protein YaaH/PKD repeat protein